MMGAAAAAGEKVYVEDVFSTYFHTGNGSTQTITNDIDLAGEGGLVWIKSRTVGRAHMLFDTERGVHNYLMSQSTNAQSTASTTLTSFNSAGFTLGSDSTGDVNYTGNGGYASWTFRKQPKFFDVVTYTGTGSARTVAHNLGSVPGCIIVKNLGTETNWEVYHRGLDSSVPQNYKIELNNPDARQTNANTWNNTAPTSSVFTVGTNNSASGNTYVAYLFAHNAGGFGDAGTDNVISCGSFTSTGQVTLGYEPQWVMMKSTTNTGDYTGDWRIFDNMRGISIGGDDNQLFANSSRAEDTNTFGTAVSFNATGFNVEGQGNYGSSTIYIAIRRGPMRAPESGTEVFAASTAAANTLFATGITSLDGAFIVNRTVNGGARSFFSRLTASRGLDPTSTAAEANYGTAISWDLNNAFYQSAIGSSVQWLFRRAPGFFDVVAYTGTSATHNVNHNLGVAPELIIHKPRNSSSYYFAVTDVASTSWGQFGTDAAFNTSFIYWNNGITDTYIGTTSSGTHVNESGYTYIAYLFASCPGVSKVGSYTGTGTTLNIDCGFTAGARLVLIKRTDSTGSWYIWDTARGIVSGNDPYLLLNSTAAEVTNTDYIDPLSSGFQITSTAPAEINASGGSYIFLAVA
jgi:hypothetical protein